MALAITSVTNSIAALNVTGLTIADVDEIPENATVRVPLLIPKPDGFVTELIYEIDSQGDGATALANVYYTLNYRLLYAPVGSERGLFVQYPAMVEMAADVIDAVIAINNATAGGVEIVPLTVSVFGPVADPAGNLYHGCDIAIRVLEFVN